VGDEALTPTPRTRELFGKMDSEFTEFSVIRGGPSEESKSGDFMKAMEKSSQNKKEFLGQVSELPVDHPVWDHQLDEVISICLEALKGSDFQVREAGQDALLIVVKRQGRRLQREQIDAILGGVVKLMAANKKVSQQDDYSQMQGTGNQVLEELLEGGADPTLIFQTIKGFLGEQSSDNLSAFIKAASHLISKAPKDRCFDLFSIILPDLLHVTPIEI